tara:strand:- start:1742 stop:1972 length:231 start_codon:yes stop_codon:yes gene_type:complete
MKHEIIDKEITEILSDIDYDLTTTKDDLLDTLWEIQRVQVKQMQELHKYLGNLKDLEHKMTKLRGELKVRGVTNGI